MDAQRDEEAAAAAGLLLAAPAGSTRSPAADAHILSAAFLFVFAAYGAAQNLESTVNTEDPVHLLHALLGGRAAGGDAAGAQARARRRQQRLRALHPRQPRPDMVRALYTIVPASLYLGFCALIIWVGQGTYLTSAALSHARDNNLPEGQTLGNFTGEFWGIIASTQVIGNLLSLALLRNEKDGGSVTGKNLLFVVFLGCMIVGIVLLCLLSKREEKGYNDPLHSSFGAMLESLKDRRMPFIIPLMVYIGLEHAFVWAVFTKSIVTPVLGISGVGGAMTIYGAACAVCALVTGYLTSGLYSATLIVSFGAIVQAVVLFWLLLFYSPMDRVLGAAAPLLIGALWGVGDGMLNTQLNAVVGLMFEDAKEAAFAQFKVWECGAIATIFFLSLHIMLQVMLVLMTASLVISFGAFLFLTIAVEKSSSAVRS
ncbi:UNC93-like protein 3 isoform X1 [Panicum hallii]|uniref:UNC93-like protein 3 isoform X1 n=1 Tax=Panicum hallii TaxID=206008 RepID=UPI000DF4D8F4|nr:UNC93-like protein 3 isoform X1 [Panicum hallii]